MAFCDTREKSRSGTLQLKKHGGDDGLLLSCRRKRKNPTSTSKTPKKLEQGGNRDQLRKTVRHQFKKNATLKDPAAIEAAKETAVRGLSNFMFQEAQRMAKDQTAATAVTKDG